MVELMARAPVGASANGSLNSPKPQTEAERVQIWLGVQIWLDANLRRAKRDGLFAVVGELTPVLAELLLSRNADNRPGSLSGLKELVKNIRNGDFQLNGETVIISEDGELNDGQHRCWGVIEAGRSIQTLFAFGAKRVSRTTVDQGRARTVGDYLAMDGIPNGNHHAAVARLIWLYDNLGKLTRSPDQQPTKAQVRELAHAHKDGINKSIRAVPKKNSRLAGGLTNLAFCHFQFAQIDRDAADHFIAKLVKGNDLPESNTIYVCRERLRADERERLRADEKIEMIFHTWNAQRRGRPLRQIRVLGSLPPLER